MAADTGGPKRSAKPRRSEEQIKLEQPEGNLTLPWLVIEQVLVELAPRSDLRLLIPELIAAFRERENSVTPDVILKWIIGTVAPLSYVSAKGDKSTSD